MSVTTRYFTSLAAIMLSAIETHAWFLCSSHRQSVQLQASNFEDSSVGDYVKGVHGGKYQFSAAGLNSAGQEFAASGYGSGPIELEDDNDVPRWAQHMGTNAEDLQRTGSEVLTLPASVSVQNQERTWEPFFVKVMLAQQNGTAVDVSEAFSITPARGKLAPLGGAQNPYNPHEPYLDSVTIQVDRTTPGLWDVCYLAVGTEEEKWFYQLK
jgi:hypothetical protein